MPSRALSTLEAFFASLEGHLGLPRPGRDVNAHCCMLSLPHKTRGRLAQPIRSFIGSEQGRVVTPAVRVKSESTNKAWPLREPIVQSVHDSTTSTALLLSSCSSWKLECCEELCSLRTAVASIALGSSSPNLLKGFFAVPATAVRCPLLLSNPVFWGGSAFRVLQAPLEPS